MMKLSRIFLFSLFFSNGLNLLATASEATIAATEEAIASEGNAQADSFPMSVAFNELTIRLGKMDVIIAKGNVTEDTQELQEVMKYLNERNHKDIADLILTQLRTDKEAIELLEKDFSGLFQELKDSGRNDLSASPEKYRDFLERAEALSKDFMKSKNSLARKAREKLSESELAYLGRLNHGTLRASHIQVMHNYR